MDKNQIEAGFLPRRHRSRDISPESDMHPNTHAHTHTCVHTSIHVYIYTSIYIHTRTHTYTYGRTNTPLYIIEHTHTSTYAHTHKHTQAHLFPPPKACMRMPCALGREPWREGGPRLCTAAPHRTRRSGRGASTLWRYLRGKGGKGDEGEGEDR